MTRITQVSVRPWADDAIVAPRARLIGAFYQRENLLRVLIRVNTVEARLVWLHLMEQQMSGARQRVFIRHGEEWVYDAAGYVQKLTYFMERGNDDWELRAIIGLDPSIRPDME